MMQDSVFKEAIKKTKGSLSQLGNMYRSCVILIIIMIIIIIKIMIVIIIIIIITIIIT